MTTTLFKPRNLSVERYNDNVTTARKHKKTNWIFILYYFLIMAHTEQYTTQENNY